MKKYSILCLIFLMLSSCESFLDTDNYTEKNSSNFPVNPTDVDMMLTSIYSCFNQMVADDKPHVCQTPFYIAEIASDERLGGGARQDLSYQTVDHLMNYSSNMMQTLWKYCYQGIYRTNMLLENADRIKGWESDDQKNQDRKSVV